VASAEALEGGCWHGDPIRGNILNVASLEKATDRDITLERLRSSKHPDAMAMADLGSLARDLVELSDEMTRALADGRRRDGRRDSPVRTMVRHLLCAGRSMAGAGLTMLGGRAPYNAMNVVAAAPVARSLLESLVTLVFVLDKPETRGRRFMRSSWENKKLDIDRYRKRFGGQAAWDLWIQEAEGGQQDLERELKALGENTRSKFDKKDRWPPPGQMAGQAAKASTNRYLTFLHDWFGRELSDASHFTWNGLGVFGTCVLQDDRGERQSAVKKHRMRLVIVFVALMLALVTEVDATYDLGWKNEIQKMWSAIARLRSDAADLYDESWLHAHGRPSPRSSGARE
jgi:hypothetical protein